MNSSQKNRLVDRAFQVFAVLCTAFGVAVLLLLLADVVSRGAGRLSWEFLSNLPSRFPERAGIYTALMGMLWLMVMTVLIAFPLGIGAGIYLEEYGKKSRLANLIEINISNLAGVPSVIYGILGLELFNRMLALGNSLLAGALTLALLILPIIIVSTREAIKAVPKSLREGSLALGASRWQTIRHVVLPSAFGGIITGLILSISRAVGETAPLIVVGALVYIPFVPEGPLDEFTVLPIQIFNWITRPQEGFVINAAAAIIVLLLFTFLLNGIAVYLRNRWYQKVKL